MQKSGTNPLIIGAAGAAVGALAVSLADQKKRKKVENIIAEGYKQGEKMSNTLKKKAQLDSVRF